jgi:hypothetical protein
METTNKNTEIQKRNKSFRLFPVLFSVVVALLLLCSELDDERGDTIGIVVAFLFVSCLLLIMVVYSCRKTKRNQSE